MGSHTLHQLKRLSFDELKDLFETTMRRVQTFHPIESEGDKTVPELTTGSSKRVEEVNLDHEGSKKQKTNEASGTASAEVSTASPEVKTVAESLVYIRRSTGNRKDKGKAIMKEVEPVQKKTKLQLGQERLGYEEALRLQEQLDEEERQRIARKLQVKERGNFSEVEKARLLVEMINERKRLSAQQRAEQRWNKPITQAQQRTYMCNYIKHMGSHTLQQLKRLSFHELKALFETTMRKVQTFHPIESEGDKTVPELTTRSSKRVAEVELDHEGSKKQKTNEASGSIQEQPEEEETELP
ncbi:hypothetical protein Tco_0892583 [Tanacetum coccineum]|uniref:Pinin/SDK/MemA protein domain-containing protein n=1 Tax=Tanacetum coccineum TaxID=301880 RepID=A0ABQ5C6K7_9ASTR